MKFKKLNNLSLTQKRYLAAYVFISPFLIGFILFVFQPFIQSIMFSLSDLQITTEGFNLDFIGFENYRYALFVHADFVRVFTETTIAILTNIPAIIIFSFFAASILNQKFKGRLFARVIFFLPVILTAGVIVRMGQADTISGQMSIGRQVAGGFLSGPAVEGFLTQLRLPELIIEYIITAVNQIPEIINKSAIPILIFLAGLQSIPKSLYESADIEGATAWESFWKITFPLLSPLFITNIVYIIVDSFTAMDNPLVRLIQESAWGRGIYGATVAMSWMYFLSISLILIIVFVILNRFVFYME